MKKVTADKNSGGKIVLIVLVTIFIIIGGVIGCCIAVNKLLIVYEGATCSASQLCEKGFNCVGTTCSSGKLKSYCESKTDCLTPYCIDNVCRDDININIFVDEEPKNSDNLKKIIIATVTVGLVDGNLTVKSSSNSGADIVRLNKALGEIEKRPTLTLTGENERIIDGMHVIAMESWEVKKGEPDYVYAVVETLRTEFGFYSEVVR